MSNLFQLELMVQQIERLERIIDGLHEAKEYALAEEALLRLQSLKESAKALYIISL